MGRDHVEGMDGRGVDGDAAQGPRVVPSAQARADGARDRPGDGETPAADRAGEGRPAPQGPDGMKKAARPSTRNSSAATACTILRGRRLAMASPNSTTGALTSSMPTVVPAVTRTSELKRAARATVAICVLSPISTMKKATRVARNAPA